MKTRTLALLLPLAAAACDQASTLPTGDVAPFSISYEKAAGSQGSLAGADGVQRFYRVYGSGRETTVVLGGPALPVRSF